MKPAAESEDPSPVIDAAFFENILETDLANIVKKASSGLPLNKREREMIEEERTRHTKNAAPSNFKLEGEGAKSPLEKMNQAQLADAWGYSVRSIKGWLADGREKGDPCPLTRPEEMPEWFARVHSPRQCPDKLRDSAARLLENNEATSAPTIAAAPAIERIEIPEEAKGMLAMLDRLRTAEATLYQNYMGAVAAGNEQRSTYLMKEWSQVAEKLRALEKVAPETLEKLGLYVKKAEVVRELETLHRAIVKTVRQALRLSRARLRAAEKVEDWNQITDRIVDEICEMLVETDFAEPLELESPAAA
ncbi:MAG: hypothetical protein ABIT37_01695 [Luteolibacter sp.]